MNDKQLLMAMSALQPRTHTEYVTREVHEHRAPTDASVKLLREMEDAAHKKVLETVRLENNGFEAVLHRMEEFASGDTLWKCVYSLNGKRCVTDVRMSWNEKDADAPERIRDEMAKRIAGEILVPAIAAAWRGR